MIHVHAADTAHYFQIFFFTLFVMLSFAIFITPDACRLFSSLFSPFSPFLCCQRASAFDEDADTPARAWRREVLLFAFQAKPLAP
jgi:hypothetical protein